MTLKLLIKKLYLEEENYLDSALLKKYCKELKLEYYVVIRYLTHHKYLYRILRGAFYKPSIEERKLNKISVNHLEAISHALKMKNIKNWYLGMESALKMNNLTHEYYAIENIINDKIFRHKPFMILGRKIKFIKIKATLTNFGIIEKKGIRYSNPEKTLLDIVYLSRYDGLSEKEITDKTYSLLKECSKEKLNRYACNYNNAVRKYVGKI